MTRNWLCVNADLHARAFTTLLAAEVWAEEESRRTGRAVEIRGTATYDVAYVVDPDGKKREVRERE